MSALPTIPDSSTARTIKGRDAQGEYQIVVQDVHGRIAVSLWRSGSRIPATVMLPASDAEMFFRGSLEAARIVQSIEAEREL